MRFIKILIILPFISLQSCISLFFEAFDPPKSLYTFGFMNQKGEMVIPFGFEGALDFSEGLAPVKLGGKWGYINAKGEVVIGFQFLTAKPFGSDPVVAAVEIENEEFPGKGFGYIDKKGNWFIPPKFYNGSTFQNGVANVATEKFRYKQVSWRYDKYFLTKDLKKIYHNGLYSYYSGPGGFSEGLLPACKDGKWGFKNTDDRWIIEPKYTIVNDFKEGLAAVQITTPNPYNDCYLISETEPNGLWGYIDKTGKDVLPLRYKMASDFQNGFAVVDEFYKEKEFPPYKKFTRYFINKEGKKQFNMQFQSARLIPYTNISIVGDEEKNSLTNQLNTNVIFPMNGKKIELTLESGEKIFSIRPGNEENFRIVFQNESNPKETIYYSRYYHSKNLSLLIDKKFPPTFRNFSSPPNNMSGDFYEGLAWVAKEATTK